MSVKVYLARGMTGRKERDVVKEAESERKFFRKCGFQVFDPVEEENIKPNARMLQTTKNKMDFYWPRDKALIREANVFIDCTPHLKSQGVEREAGYNRYFLWKPTVRIFPQGKLPQEGNVSYYEDDLITDSFVYAASIIHQTWGTAWKRFIWRVKILSKGLAKFLYYQIKELINV